VNALFTFDTVSAALNCERVFKRLNTPCRIIPVPRALESSCGYAITAETDDIDALGASLRANGANYKSASGSHPCL
jgi:hypothetical protein